MNSSKTSRIEDHEEDEVKEALLKKYRETDPDFYLPIACNRQIVVALYLRPDEFHRFKNEVTGEELMFELPTVATRDDKYKSCTGVVLAVSPDAYSDEKWFKSGPECKVGDIVVFPRHAGIQVNYRKIPVHYMPSDAISGILIDPTDVILY